MAVASMATYYANSLPAMYAVRICFGFAIAGMLPAANAIIHRVIRGSPFCRAENRDDTMRLSFSELIFALRVRRQRRHGDRLRRRTGQRLRRPDGLPGRRHRRLGGLRRPGLRRPALRHGNLHRRGLSLAVIPDG